ncbi:hypothetical protein ACLX1H_000930 [Fusarium chlamydosporum]
MATQRTSVAKTAGWLYHESGISAVYGAGKDAWLLILSRTCRMFAFKAVTLTIAQFFSELGFSDFRIGLFMSLTLLGDVVLGLVVTLMADGLGRRRVLVAGGVLMACSGVVFSIFENFWILLLAAVVGVISASGSDFGPFRAIEESMLSHITGPKTRADVLAWYITSSSLGAAAGTALAGRFVETMTASKGWELVPTYHATFWVYIVMGALNVVFAFAMSNKTEAHHDDSSESSDELAEGLLRDSMDEDEDEDTSRPAPITSTPPKHASRFSGVSSGTRSVMYRLWFLLTIDSLADGMVSESLTTYFLDTNGVMITVILLFIRMGLNNMDQAPRAAFIAAVVKPEERTAVMGITSTLRTLAMATGPSLTGGLAESGKFWIAFVVGGVLRIMYDLGLWFMFINMKLHTHEAPQDEAAPRGQSIDEEDVEMLRQSVERSSDSSEED